MCSTISHRKNVLCPDGVGEGRGGQCVRVHYIVHFLRVSGCTRTTSRQLYPLLVSFFSRKIKIVLKDFIFTLLVLDRVFSKDTLNF